MPKNRMTEKLITAFNADNLFYNTVNTNLTLERGTLRDYIVIKFDKDMDYERGMSYMKSLKEKLIKRFFITEDDAGIAFDMRSFPFNLTEGKLQPSKKGIKYVVPVSEGTILNLKCYLMFSFAKDIGKKLGEIFGVEYIDNSLGYAEFDHKYYLYCMYCEDKEVRDKFVELFQSDITSYNNVSSKLFNVEGDYVYIKDVFKNNIPLIDRMIERSFWLEGRYLQVPSSENKHVESMKHRIVSLINAKSSIPFYHTFRASYLDSKENSVFIPIMPSTDGSFRFLTQKEAKNINKVFGYSVLHNIDGCITKKQLVELLGEDCVKGIYGINFYDKETSRYIMSKVIQESVINKDHELSIDPGLRFQALSPAQSPFNSPTHAGPSGLRTPPNKRKRDTDSGYDSNSPPKPKDSGSSSGGPGPSTMEWESLTHLQNGWLPGRRLDKVELEQLKSPTRKDQDGTLKESPRQGFMEVSDGLLSVDQVDVPGTSGGFLPTTQVSYPAVSRYAQPEKCAGAAAAGAWTKPITNRLLPAFPGHFPSSDAVRPSCTSSLGTSGNERPDSAESGYLWSPGLLQFSKPLSSEGANPVGANPWVQQTNHWSSQSTHKNKWMPLPQPTQLRPIDLSWTQSRPSSSKGANPVGANPWAQQTNPYSSQSSNLKEDYEKIFEEAYKKFVSGSSLSKKEENLIKALLDMFNFYNYSHDMVNTNFTVKDGKIVSLLHDNVDREEYLQAVIKCIIEEYYETEKEARKSCDFDEFPFKFLPDPDYEKNQNDCEPKKTVVANISSGALSNLKILFSQGHEGEVEIKDIDINIVEKYVESKKEEWVNFQVREHRLSPQAAIESCYPDESALKHISIIKGKGGYWIDRDYSPEEVERFKKKRWPAKGKSKAEKMKSEDNKDSGYSSGFVADAENVSSKAEATTSGYESMDCENTRGGSLKRKSPSPVGEDNPGKPPKRGSSPLSRLESLSLSSSSHQIGKC
ncbi:hypothetical protein [Wolbachia endosymbiont (group A) of Myopa testacea]|uniref:hypothetical protein n=1 Tax=Wolbachia endosymbiont (group A) of Myopa testacea TaxID=3066148 RepID=UPI00333FFDB1